MKDQALRTTTPVRRIEGPTRQARPPGATQAPSKDPSRELVFDHGQVTPVLIHLQVRNIADPNRVRSLRSPAPETIRMLSVGVLQLRFRPIHASHPATHPIRSHQARHPPPAHTGAFPRQAMENPRTPVRAAACLEDPADLSQQIPILLGTAARSALDPGVVPGARHPVQGTQTAHFETLATAFNEREYVGLLSEQNRMACFRSSCSSSRRR